MKIINKILSNTFEGSSASRSKIKSQRTGRDLPASVPQGEYKPNLYFANWGYVPHYGRDDFLPPPFNINDIDVMIALDSLVSRAVFRYIQLIFKEGFTLYSKNPDNVEYIRKRFRIWESDNGHGLDWVLEKIASDIVRYGNSVMVKSRYRKEQMPLVKMAFQPLTNGRTVRGITGKNPISNVWWQEMAYMEAKVNDYGIPTVYREVVNSEEKIKWSAKDVWHFTIDRPAKSIWGRSFLLPVIDDVKILRSIEGHILEIVYRYLNPLYHVKVGASDPDKGLLAQKGEVKEIREIIRNTPPDGIFVTDGRVEIKDITGTTNRMTGQDYLEYFQKRVLVGLGVSGPVMGIGDQTNRGTSDNLVAQMRDNIRTFQNVLARQVTDQIFDELLEEINIDSRLEDQRVYLKYNEIDSDLQFKKSNDAVQKFTNNGTTHPEFRRELGYDPVSDEELELLFFNLVQKQQTQLEGDIQSSIAQQKAKQSTISNKTRPANQHGKKSSPKRKYESIESGELIDNVDAIYDLSGGLAYIFMIGNRCATYAGLEWNIDKDVIDPTIRYYTALEEYGYKMGITLQTAIDSAINIANKLHNGEIKESELEDEVLNNVLVGVYHE